MVSRLTVSRVKQHLRSRIRKRPLHEALECSVPDFLKWVESQWKPGMSWDNYGFRSNQWQLSTVVPGYVQYWNFRPSEGPLPPCSSLDVLAAVCCAARKD